MTYSQFGQDDKIIDFFGGKKKGWFVDVGAHSNGNDTLLLEKMGWNGICIEPCDDLFKKLTSCRTCVCRNVCIGDKDGDVDFYWNQGYTSALSGVLEYYSSEHLNRIQKENQHYGGNTTIVKKQIKRLTTLLGEVNAPTHIELLKIDVEGGEYAVLCGIDFSKYTFDLITIEVNYQHEYVKSKKILNNNGYEEFMTVGIDKFFRPISEMN